MREPVKGKPVDPPTPWERSKPKIYALILIALILGLAGLSAAAYNKAFDGTVPVTLKAGRAGLQMQAGNRVKVRGVDLGRVDSVKLSDDQKGVDITLALDPDLLAQVPDNATVSLEQLSAFGNKAVQINFPAQPSGKFLAEGAVIDTNHISVEVNSTFDSLMTLLNRVQPSKLNAVLGGLANTFEGNGDRLGSTLTLTNAYLKKFNGDLPELQRNWRSVGAFSNVYADVADPFVDALRDVGAFTDVFADKHEAFSTLFDEIAMAGDELVSFFDENSDPLVGMLRSLRPTTSLLDEYSPMITCFVDGAGVNYDQLMSKLWSAGFARFEFNFQQPGATEMYHYPQDLPVNGPGREKGPNCRGLPVVSPNEDSLADYTTGPESLNQRYIDNSPRLATQPGQAPPLTSPPLSYPFPAAGPKVPLLVKAFGPEALAPTKAKLKKVGK